MRKIILFIQRSVHALKQNEDPSKPGNIKIVIGLFLSCLLGLGIVLAFYLKHYTAHWGLSGTFYEDRSFYKYISSGISKAINFTNYSEMNGQIPPENFSARWQGYLLIPQDDRYTFFLTADDGAKLFIDGQCLIDEWQDNDSTEFTTALLLKKGKHALRIDYYNHWGKAVLKLFWMHDGQRKTLVPAHYFRNE